MKIIYKKDQVLKLENRKEYKFLYNDYELSNLFSTYKKNLEPLYPDRKISSMYLDTANFELYNNSKNTDTDKLKVRFRMYPTDNQIYFEIKRNSDKNKTKVKELTSYKSFNEIDFKLLEGKHLTPVLKVDYLRSYFTFKNTRITIDKNVSFQSTVNRSLVNKIINLDFNVVEFKLFNQDKDIEKNFLSNPIAFSKYDYGIKSIYKI